jgi:hypothetical protein
MFLKRLISCSRRGVAPRPTPTPHKTAGNSIMVKKESKKEVYKDFFDFLHTNVSSLNNSKFFAGLVIISLNIASKFVTIKLSKTTETYLKYTFSRQILIFAMAWMATRDIYMALILTACFVVLADYLFNENSKFCCFTEDFKHHYLNLGMFAPPTAAVGGAGAPAGAGPIQNSPTEEDVKRSIDILEKVKKQQEEKTQPNYNTPFTFIR